MIIYISGPISGRPNGNRELFSATAKLLTDVGHVVVNPFDVQPEHPVGPSCFGKSLDNGDLSDSHRYGCHLLADMQALAGCTHLLRLPGWEESPGARAEVAFARACGIEIFS